MKWLFILLSVFTCYADGVCPLTEEGSSVFGPGGKGYIDWHGFIPGTQSDTHRQVVTGASVHPSSTTWLATNAGSTQGIVLNQPQYQTDYGTVPSGWQGQVIHYVHGNTARRIPLKSATAGVDPGTIPVPPKPRIAGYYGPNSRPRAGGQFGPYVVDPAYLIQTATVSTASGDRQMHVVDIDNCIEYDAAGCDDFGSSIGCENFGAYDMLAGDGQRPYNIANVSNTSSVSGIQQLKGRIGYDEWKSPTGIQHAINVTMMNGLGFLVGAFTGSATIGQYESPAWDPARLPFGSKIRLKASFDPAAAGVPSDCMPLVTALKTYGAIYVDGGITANAATQEAGNLWPWDCYAGATGAVLFSAANAEVVVQNQSKIFCAYNFTGCPDALPTGSAPTISSFSINGGPSAAVTLSGSKQTLVLSWAVSGVTDMAGFPVRLRYVSWGPNNRFGPGAVDGLNHGEKVNVTVCASRTCDIQNKGTYPIQLMVQNRFGRTTANVNLTVQ